MTPEQHDEQHDPAPVDAEREALDALGARLMAERPVPAAAFRGDLRRALVRAPRSRGVRLRAVAFLASGVALLAVAALGSLGSGPLAPNSAPVQAAQVVTQR